MSMEQIETEQDAISIWRQIKSERTSFLQARDRIKINIEKLKKLSIYTENADIDEKAQIDDLLQKLKDIGA